MAFRNPSRLLPRVSENDSLELRRLRNVTVPRRARRSGPARTTLQLEDLEDRSLLSATWASDFTNFVPSQRNLFNYDGYLTGPSGQTPIAIAENYLRTHSADLGILAADVDNYRVTTNYVTQTTGATTLTFQQSLYGVEVANANYNITVAADGRLLSVAGGFISGLSQRTLSSLPSAVYTVPQAIGATATGLGLSPSGAPTFISNDHNARFRYSAPGVSLDDIVAHVRYVPYSDSDVRLTWNFDVRTPDNQNWFNVDVDATSGDLRGLVNYSSDATYEVYPIPNRDPNDGPRTVLTNPNIFVPTPATVPSPYGWHDTNGATGAEFTTTQGNNVSAYTDADGDNSPDANSQPNGGANLDFTGALVNIDLTQAPSTYSAASVVNLFYLTNFLHDVHYLYGFDEAARNFQVNNYGRGGTGGDAVNSEAQDGSGLNNANFFTPPDGQAPRMQMFLFNATTPGRDGSLDAEVVLHEFGHGISNRLTGNGTGLFALQSSGMGEGWSDFWSLMLTQKSASETTDGRGVGNYVLGLPSTGPGIRAFKYDFDIGNTNLETFLNYGTGIGQNLESHEVGTRWSAALWDINKLMIDKYGFNPNVYDSTSGAGNIRTLHLVMNALKIQAITPTFIQARDAVLLADELLYGGANQYEIWTAFARRGLGVGAATADSDSFVLTTSFDIPPGLIPVISMGSDVAKLEGNSGTTAIVFSLSIAGSLNNQAATVTYATANGTAAAGSDYNAAAGTVTFLPDGPRTQTITVQILGDNAVEANETFLVNLGAAVNATVARNQAVGTILNDDVDLVINDITVVEGNSGTSNAVLTVSTIGVVNQSISFTYGTSSGTANGGEDFVPKSGTATIAPGASSAKITVPIVGDTANEETESFFVTMVAPVNARIIKGVGTITVVDNDAIPNFYVNDVNITSAIDGTLAAVFTVALDAKSGRTVAVHYATANDTASAGADYDSRSGDLTFIPGVSTLKVTVPVTTSAVYSPNERFLLNLSGATNAQIADGTGICTIIFGTPPPVEFIMDNGEPGYTTTGSAWTNVTNLVAYQLDYDYHAPGTGSAAANWNFTGIPAGTYQVFTRWSAFGNRATNAQYTVYDSSTALGTVSVNQQVAPVGDTSNGIVWQSLGTFTTNSASLRVRLTDNANGFVTADAVRIVSGGVVSQTPEIDVAGYDHSIADNDNTPSLDDATDFSIVNVNSSSSLHEFKVTNTGNGPLHLGGSPRVQITGAAAGDFSVVSYPDFTIAPGATGTFTVLFHPTVDGVREATISLLSDDADEAVYNFDVRGIGGSAGPSLLVMDDGDDGFVAAGQWGSTNHQLAYGGDFLTSAAGNGSDRTYWNFINLGPGTYEVFANWIGAENQATNAPFTVSNGNGVSFVTLVNQQNNSAGIHGTSLGTIVVNNGQLSVALSDNANGLVAADNIVITRLGAVDLIPPALPLAHNSVLPLDVNADGLVSARDALIVINALAASSNSQNALPQATPLAATGSAAQYFKDVNGDGLITPRDALMVINYLLDPAGHSGATAGALAATPLAALAAEPVVDESTEVPTASPAALVAVAVDLAIGEPAAPTAAPPANSSLVTSGAAAPATSTAGDQAAASDAAFVALGLDDAEDAESDDDLTGDLVDAWDAGAA